MPAPMLVLIAVGALPTPAAALAVGDCADPHLHAIRDALTTQLRVTFPGLEIVDADALGRALGRRSSRPVHDLKARLDSAHQSYLAGQNLEALKALEVVREEVDGLAPGAERWELKKSAELLTALVLREARQRPEMAEAFKRVLRIEPGARLDPDLYADSVRAEFEEVRKQLASAPRGWMNVVSQPSGAAVFLDGFEVGRTPFAGELPQGTYRVQVRSGQEVSLTRTIQLRHEARVAIDLELDRLIFADRPICVRGDPVRAPLLAASFGRAVRIDDIVAVTVAAEPDGSQRVEARRIDVRDSKVSPAATVRLGRVWSPAELKPLAVSLGEAKNSPATDIDSDGPVTSSRRACPGNDSFRVTLGLASLPVLLSVPEKYRPRAGECADR